MIRELFLSDFSLSSCVWQSTIFLVVGLVGSFILRHRSARAHQVLFLAMMAAVIVPMMSILVKHYELGMFVAEPVVIQSSAEDWAITSNYGASGVISAEDIEHKPGAIEEILPSAMAGSESAKLPWRSLVLGGWIAASLILAARLLLTFALGVRLLGRALPLNCEKIEEAVHLAKAKLGIDKDVMVRSSRGVRSPVIWCWRRRPVLLVPSAAGRFDNGVDWAGVLCHELAHYKRRDHISGLLAELVACILPWHPLVWWAKSRLVRLSEQACDDWVVATGQPGTDYAESLLDLIPGGQMAFVPAVVSTKRGLAGRVHRILKDKCGNPRTGTKWALATSLATLCLTVGVALAQTRPAESANTKAQERPPAKSLHQAVADGDLAEVRRLIAEGADINVKNKRNMAPLEWGLFMDSLTKEVAELLIEKGANVNVQDEDGWSTLYGAIYVGTDKDIVKLLVSRGADVNLTTKKGETPLHCAIEMGDIDIVKLLVDKGADFNLKNEKGWTALRRAVLSGRNDMVQLFLSKGADTSSFHMAAFVGDLGSVKDFVARGTEVDSKDEIGWTPLFWAACAGQQEVAEFLIGRNADINANDGNGRSLLPQAAQAQTDAVKLVALLIAKGADINAKEDSRKDTPLHLACYAGNREVAELLIGEGADINAKNKGGRTPLHCAALSNHKEVVKLLVSKGADVNAENNIGFTRYTPLHHAAMVDADIAEFLIAHGAQVDAASGSFGRTPLHQAVITGKTHIVELLIDKGADINASDRVPGIAPLAWAVRQANAEIVELLITKGADVNVENKAGRTPLDMAEKRGDTQIVEILQEHGAKKGSPSLPVAVTSGNIEQVKLLISQGADVNAKDEDGRTALHQACLHGRTDIAEFLIASGADINATDDLWGARPLGLAGYEGHKDNAGLLVSKGADIKHKNRWGNTALSEAAHRGNLEVAKLLLAEGAEVDEKNYYDQTPLHRAVDSGHKEMVELLVAKGADIKATRFGETAIHRAMIMNQPEMVRFLLATGLQTSPINVAAYFGELDKVKGLVAKGTDVNAQDACGYSPLYCAACGEHRQLMEFLIGKGADVNVKDGRGFAPLHQASWNGRKDIAELLIAKGADVNAEARYGSTPLYWASYEGHKEIVQLLLDKGADVNSTHRGREKASDGNWKPLHMACRNGHKAVAELLIAKGAEVDVKTKTGKTPLSLAKEKGHTEIVELLRKHGARE